MYPTNPDGTHTGTKQSQTYINLSMLYFMIFVHVSEVAIAITAWSTDRLSIIASAQTIAESFDSWSVAEHFAIQDDILKWVRRKQKCRWPLQLFGICFMATNSAQMRPSCVPNSPSVLILLVLLLELKWVSILHVVVLSRSLHRKLEDGHMGPSET